MVKSYTSTEYLPYAGTIGLGLPQLAEGDVLRWSFRTYNDEFNVRVWIENGAYYLISEGLTSAGGIG